MFLGLKGQARQAEPTVIDFYVVELLWEELSMPMHDWKRVDPNDYHHFHCSWIVALSNALNNGLLPEGFIALAEHSTPPIVPDVVTLSIPNIPPRKLSPREKSDRGGVALTEQQASIVATAVAKTVLRARPRRIAVQHARSRQIVAVIEIVSPSNKADRKEFAKLVGKTVQLLEQGIHVVLIDPFPPTARDPKGIHAAVWKDLTGKTFTPPEGKPLTIASYVALGEATFTAYVEPIKVGDRLLDTRLFITSEYHVMIPLEETYQTAWQGYPSQLRTEVEGS